MFNLALLFVLVIVLVLFSIASSRLGKRELVHVLFVLLFVYFARVKYCPPTFPLGVRGWLRLVTVALPGLSTSSPWVSM